MVLGSLGPEGAGSPEPEVVVHFGAGGNSFVAVHLVSVFLVFCWNCFWCSSSQSSSIFLQMGQFSPHPHCSAFGGGAALVVVCSGAWGSIFIGGLELVAAVALLVGRISQYFLSSKRFPDIFPALGHGVLA